MRILPCCRLPRQFDAAIASATFEGVIGVHWPRRAESGSSGKAVLRDVVTVHQLVNDRLGTPLRQIEIGLIPPDVVGVAFDGEFPVGMGAHDLRDFFQHLVRFRSKVGAGEIEVKVVNLRPAILLEVLLELIRWPLGIPVNFYDLLVAPSVDPAASTNGLSGSSKT